jgi:ribosomal protein L19
MTTNFNTSPYFDDFDKDKNFYRVLFKPGYAVQARELNQLQSILQHQVSSVGNHLFKKNTIVIPGGISLLTAADIISISDIGDPSTLLGKTITNAVTFDPTDDDTINDYITAIVLAYRPATSTDPAALYIKYFKSQVDGRSVFNQSEPLKTVDTSIISFKVHDTIGATKGKVATLSAGTFYTKEIFVDTDTQSVIIEVDNSVTTNCHVGLNIVESIVTSDDDESLLDNAAGAPNQYAPGADRYKISLVLARIDDATSIDDEKFIKMMTIENNSITFLNNKTQYAEIMKTLARRTYDANGNFIVTGLDTSITQAPDDNFVWANVTSGRCYLGGYEYEQIVNTPIALDKPRASKYQKTMDRVTRYTADMTYVYIAGGTFCKDIPVENSLVQFVDTNPLQVTFASAAVNTGTEVITITAHKLATGSPVIYNMGAGTVITGLTNNATYYVIYDTANTIKLAASSVDAYAGTAINLTGAGTGTTHTLTKVLKVVGYGVFKDLQYALGTIGSTDVYKMFFDYIVLETGYTYNDIGGIRNIINNEGSPVLHRLQLSNIIGTITTGNNIVSTTDSTQVAYIYNFLNGYAYVIRNSPRAVPFSATVKDATTNATATLAKTFITNYSTASYPMIKIDNDIVKTLYNGSNVNTTTYSYIHAKTFTNIGVGTLSMTLSPPDIFEDFSTSDFFGFITSAGYESFVDLTGLLSITGGGLTYEITIAGGSPLLGRDMVVYSTINRTNVVEANKTKVTTSSGVVITTPSRSPMALSHQDIISIDKVVAGRTVGIESITWASSKATVVTSETNDLIVNDTIVLSNITPSGYNGVAKVTDIVSPTSFKYAVAVNPGAYVPNTADIVALPPNINSDPEITNQFVFNSGNTPYLSGVGTIKLVKRARIPAGQIAVKYTYPTLGTGGYVSVDSYGLHTGDLSYIGDIQDIPIDSENFIELRKYIDFRTRPSSYYFRNIAKMTSGSTTIALKNLNLSIKDIHTVLVGKYVVGPGHLNGTTITGMSYNITTGNTELILNTASSVSGTGVYYIGLNGASLSLVDPAYGGKAFETPKDSTYISYQYVKFLPRHLMLYINRQADSLQVDYKDIESKNDIVPYVRNEYKLPLAYMYMKPYTVGIEDITLEKFENPVYQMLDIHHIKKRVDRNEYYTALALSQDQHTEIDNAESGYSQAARGIWSENFMDVANQDYLSPDYACTIYDKNYVAPGTVTRTVPLALTTLNSTTFKQTGTAITLPYTEVRAFGNTAASRSNNLNPFNAINWSGKLILNPSVDNWVDVTYASAATNTTTTTVNTPKIDIIVQAPPPPPIVVQAAPPPPPFVPPPPPPVITVPPPVVPPPPPVEIVTQINNMVVAWGPDTALGKHAISFEWVTNLGRVGWVSNDAHLSPVIAQYGFNGIYARSLINRLYEDPEVKAYLHAGAPLYNRIIWSRAGR